MTVRLVCQPDPAACDASACELLVLPFWEGPEPASDLSSWKEIFEAPIANGDFKAKAGETLLLYFKKGRILLLGLGKKEGVSSEAIKRAYAAAVRSAQEKRVKKIHLAFPEIPSLESDAALRAVAEGVLLTNYAFLHLKGESLKDKPVVLLKEAYFLGLNKAQDEKLKKWQTIASGVHLARELVNGNADDVTPQMLAETAKEWEKKTSGLKATILERKAIEDEKMGLLLAVSRGSSCDPCLILLSYHGNPSSKDHVVLVGKGVTYDTGGLSLKPTESMLTMKCDMAGAATALAAVQTAAALGLPVNVTAVAPATENAIDAQSYKIGDVYKAMNGKTVEITNTDAEGRLILADALSYAVKHLKPSLIIDLASLTGAIVVALGEDLSGVFCDDEPLVKELVSASNTVGEPLWRMPLVADYKEMLKSDIADMVNSAGRSASSITAALFLQEFCGKVPWAHIDFAGSCFLTKPKHINTTKATGFGVRLLIEFLERRQK